MIIPARFLLLCLLLPLPAAELRLLGGTPLAGEFLRESGGSLLWIPEWDPNPVRISLAHVHSYTGRNPQGLPVNPLQRFRIFFTNGDRLLAQSMQQQGEQLQLRLLGGDTLLADLRMISEIEPLPSDAARLILGPLPFNRWWVQAPVPPPVGAEPRPRNVEGLLYIPQNTVAMYPLPSLPPRFRLRMVVDLQSPASRLQVTLFAPPAAESRVTGVTLALNANNMTLQHNQLRRNETLTRRNAGPDYPWADTMEIEFFFDRPAGKFHLVMNHSLIETLDISEGLHEHLQQPDRWLRFQPMMTPMILRQLELQPWSYAELPATVSEPHATLLTLQRPEGPPLRGTLRSLRPNGVQLELETGEMAELAYAEVARILFPAESRHQPRRRSRDIRVWLPRHQALLTLALQEWNETRLTGTQEIWAAPLTFPRSEIGEIGFNPHSPHRQFLPVAPISPLPFLLGVQTP